MKICFLALFNTTNQFAYDFMRDKGCNILTHLTTAVMYTFNFFSLKKNIFVFTSVFYIHLSYLSLGPLTFYAQLLTSRRLFQWADLCKSYLVEAKWFYCGYTPTLQEYMDNASTSISCPLCFVHIYFFMQHNMKEEATVSIHEHSNLIRLTSLIFRLHDDLGTSKVCTIRSYTEPYSSGPQEP
jgi:hypothetical protein